MRLERNVIYGMYSGLALLMDVYVPEVPKGRGIIFASGSGWNAPLGLDQREGRPVRRSAGRGGVHRLRDQPPSDTPLPLPRGGGGCEAGGDDPLSCSSTVMPMRPCPLRNPRL